MTKPKHVGRGAIGLKAVSEILACVPILLRTQFGPQLQLLDLFLNLQPFITLPNRAVQVLIGIRSHRVRLAALRYSVHVFTNRELMAS